MIHVSPKTSLKLAEDFDEHGDSYTEDVEPSKLKEIFADIEYEVTISLIYHMLS